MGLPVVTVSAGGLPVVESTTGGTPVTEAANKFGIPVTKVVGKPGLPVVFETIGVVATDPSFSNVKLLMGFNGADGSTGAPGMADESSAARGIATRVASAQIDTAQFKFGDSSLLLAGTDESYLTYPDNPDWDFGTGPFTLEGFFRQSTVQPYCVLMAQWPAGWAFFFQTGILTFRPGTGSDVTYAWVPSANQWYHIAFDRDASNVARIYVDGVMRAKTTGYTVNLTGSTAVLAIGSLNPAGFNTFNFYGHMDELRITKGIARYASDVGFAVPTTAFPRS